MLNNTCQWYSDPDLTCRQLVETRPGTKYDDCFCPYHRTMFNEKPRTGSGIINLLRARAAIRMNEDEELARLIGDVRGSEVDA